MNHVSTITNSVCRNVTFRGEILLEKIEISVQKDEGKEEID